MARCLLIIQILLQTAAQGSGASLGLEEAVRYAIKHSPSLNSARRQKAIAEDNLSNAWAAFLPKLDITSTNAWEGSSPSTESNPWNGSMSLRLSQDFYLNHANITQKRIAQHQADIASIELERRIASLTLEVMETFYAFSLSQALLKVQDEQHRLIEKQFVSVSRQYKQGLKTRKDFLRFKSALRRAELQHLTLKNRVKQSIAELRRVLGVPLFEPVAFRPIQPAEKVRKFPSDMPDIKQHYDYEITQLRSRVQRDTVYLSERNYWPQLSLVGSATYLNENYFRKNSFSEDDTLSWTIGLNLTFNIWDWGILRRELAIARNQQQIQENEFRDIRLALQETLTKLRLEIGRLQESYGLSKELLGLEERSFKVLERDYRQGKVPFVDLIRGLETLNSAKINYFTVYFDSLTAIGQYQFHSREEYAFEG